MVSAAEMPLFIVIHISAVISTRVGFSSGGIPLKSP